MNKQSVFNGIKHLLVAVLCTNSLYLSASRCNLDVTFGTEGIVKTTFSGTQADATALSISMDDTLLVSGTTLIGEGHQFVCARYTSQGALDETFGSHGFTTLAIGNDASCFALARQSNGTLLMGGISDTNGALARLLSSGQLDNSFGSNGTVVPILDDQVNIRSLAYDTINQKIIAVGDIMINHWQHILLLRFNATGSLDTSFGNSGVVKLPLEQLSMANSVALQSDGKIIIGGIVFNGEHKGLVARFLSDGTLDTTFGIDGLTIIKLPEASYQQITALSVQANDKIIVTGSVATTWPTGILLAKLTASGAFDDTFGTNGIVSTAVVAGASIYSLAVQIDGKIVIAGETNNSVLIARYTSTGQLDTAFGDGGIITSQIGSQSIARTVAIQPDGKILIAGTSDNKMLIARYNANNSDFVNIASPANGSTMTSNTFEISGIASQPNMTLRVKLDDVEFATTTTDSTGRWSLGNKLIIDGEHTLTTDLMDGQTILATSSSTFTVSPAAAHSMSIASPTEGSTIATTTPTIAGAAGRASANVHIKLDGALLDTVITNSTGGWSKVASLIVNGAHTILAELMNGETTENSDTKNFTVTVANFITCTSPVPRSTITTSTTSVTGAASDANVELQILVDGQLFNVVTTDASGHWDAGTSNVLANGRHSIIVLATTAEGSLRIAATQYFMVNVV